MTDKIIEIISKITQISTEELNKNKENEDLWDSFTHIEIIMQLENDYNTRFTEEEIGQMRSINKIKNVIESKTAK